MLANGGDDALDRRCTFTRIDWMVDTPDSSPNESRQDRRRCAILHSIQLYILRTTSVFTDSTSFLPLLDPRSSPSRLGVDRPFSRLQLALKGSTDPAAEHNIDSRFPPIRRTVPSRMQGDGNRRTERAVEVRCAHTAVGAREGGSSRTPGPAVVRSTEIDRGRASRNPSDPAARGPRDDRPRRCSSPQSPSHSHPRNIRHRPNHSCSSALFASLHLLLQ